MVDKDKTALNVANGLSLLRILFAPLFMYMVFTDRYLAAVAVLIIATLSDFLDGQIARIWNMQTRVGKMLDPIADKAIIFFAALTLMIKFHFPLWLGILIVSRDLILFFGSVAYLMQNKKKILLPNLLGKVTTFVQMTTIVAYVLAIPISIKHILILLTAVLTIISGIVYFYKGYYLFFRKGRSGLNLPNKITIARILAIPIFIAFLIADMPYRETVAAAIFILLALSDAVDGYIARKRNQITSFGKLIDPLADKLLVSSALIFLIGKGIPAWMAFVIIAREFAVTGLRTVALTKQMTIQANFSGKVKTVSQIIGITMVILALPYAWEVMLIATLITIYSGIEYFWLGRNLFKELR
jgi:CDP-diacylglycerol--glycerol-3-phosphate 3-phosphatidyltransferase